jgi:hypothetical protein
MSRMPFAASNTAGIGAFAHGPASRTKATLTIRVRLIVPWRMPHPATMTLLKVAKTGGTPQPLAMAPGTPYYGIAVDSGYVYWNTSQAILKVRTDGTGSTTLVSGLNDGSPIARGGQGIAVGPTRVYWASFGDGTILSTPK